MFYEILIIFTCINLVVDIFGSELLVGDLQNLGLDLAPPYINIYIDNYESFTFVKWVSPQ